MAEPIPTVAPNKALIDGVTPCVTLAGQDWPVPMLAPRQNRVVVPAIGRWARSDHGLISTEQFDDAVMIVHTALTRGHPELTREAFEDLPITTLELMSALPVIARQTGLFKPPAAGGPKLGEGSAGEG